MNEALLVFCALYACLALPLLCVYVCALLKCLALFLELVAGKLCALYEKGLIHFKLFCLAHNKVHCFRVKQDYC
jgi:hypothetical protein